MQVCSREEDTIAEKVESNEKIEGQKPKENPSSVSSKTMRQILNMVWYKLVSNSNSYASLLGLSWALVSCSLKSWKILSQSCRMQVMGWPCSVSDCSWPCSQES
ncbi:probable auxin efflux carrier component 1c isoform X2 [Magnolia sinica]|uniref:probable auxin efflux carrier component 1c isoform X2 n=1 Tax=Magnolia sinica TaxID=86752 RepID=UPI002658EE98|nr:probable auxin efflux carrier component 1c isoform X2 [Magnolia sinica]